MRLQKLNDRLGNAFLVNTKTVVHEITPTAINIKIWLSIEEEEEEALKEWTEEEEEQALRGWTEEEEEEAAS